VLALACPAVHAQQAPPPPPVRAALTPPTLKQNAEATYPASALSDGVRVAVKVVLLLDIDATGLVKKSTVESPQGHGFDDAATEAAARLVFEPARRGPKAIPSRIRFSFDFPVPSSALTGRVFDPSGAPLASARVVVRGPTEKSTTTGPDGRWALTGLPFGTYRIAIEAAGFAVQDSTEDLAPAQEAKVTARLSVAVKTPSPAGSTSAAVPPTPPAEPRYEEVNVRGVRPSREVTRRTLDQRELSKIPGTSGDAIRAIENLPGVARPPGLAGLLIIRGSAPQDTQIFADGTNIPIIYHFGGLRSVIPTEVLDRVDFYPGNFSAQYGRAMGGIVDVGVRNPRSDGKFAGVTQVDLLDARVVAEGPIGNTGWNFTVAGRRSWVDVWLKPVLEASGAGVTTAPVYYDYQAMVSREFSPRSSFRLLFMGSDDRLEVVVRNVSGGDPGAAGDISFHTGFWRLQGLFKTRIGDNTELRVNAAVGQDIVDFSIGDIFFKVTGLPISSRIELAQKLERGVTMNLGLDWLYEPYELNVRIPPLPRPGEPPGGRFLSRPPLESKESGTIYRPGVYSDFELTPWKGGRIVPGVRVDYSRDTKGWDLAPRVVARQDIQSEFPRTTLKGGVGVYAQPPQPQETNAVFGQPGLRSNRSTHYSLGVEREITSQLEVSFEGFYKELDHLVTSNHGNLGSGRSYGLETLVRYKPDARFFGWLAYTLSRSERRDTPDEPLRLFQYDQTHILSLLGSYRLGRGWEVGLRFRLVSGSRFTRNQYGFFDQNAATNLALQSYPPFGERLPMFHQLDIRAEKTWQYSWGKFSAYLDVLNVYNQANVEGISYNYNFTQSTYGASLPIIPNFGLRGEL
jgi:TonB family protein